MHDRGLSTVIDWRGRDAHGRRLNRKQRAQVYRLRKWNRRSKVSGSTQRNLAYALSEMTKIAYKLNLPRNVIETGSMIYRRAIKKNCIRGRSIQGIVAASLYMACRKCEIIRTLEEVGEPIDISAKESGRVYRFLLRRLNADVPRYGSEGYLSKFVSQLSLPGETEILAEKVLSLAADMRLTSGRGPSGMAAAATYIACRLMAENVTQGEIAKIAGVTEVTIRNRYKELVHKINIEIEL
jgi:transcription initiation factor TFIIB